MKRIIALLLTLLLLAQAVPLCLAESAGRLTVTAADLPQVLFAKAQLEEAARKTGLAEDWTVRLETVDGSLGREAYEIRVQDHVISVTGGDAAGLMYGGFQVAEELLLSGPEGLQDQSGRPSMEYRGIKFNAPLDMRTPSYSDAGDVAQANIANMWDMDFWTEYLDFLALNRYNAFSLWNLNPFPSMVKVPEYPNVALDDVWRTTLPFDDSYNTTASNMVRPEHWENYEVLLKISIDEKIDFWRRVMAYAKDRGIRFYIYTWNVYTYGEHEQYGITPYVDNEVTRDYYRKSVKAMVETYPDLAGIGITAGEFMDWAPGMEIENEKWLWETYGLGVNDALEEDPDREFSILHRLHLTDFDAVAEIWSGFRGTFDYSDKYSVGHIHSSVTPNFVQENFARMPDGIKSWLELRNDDFFNLRWFDPDYIRAYLGGMPEARQLRGFFMGSDAYIFAREYSMKDPDFQGQLYARKHWAEFMLWGRLGYDLSVPASRFEDLIALHFRDAAPREDALKLASAMENAGKIIPLVTTFFWVSSDLYFPEASASHLSSFGFIGLKTWTNSVNTQPGAGVLSVPEYVDALVREEEVPTGRTPVETADNLKASAESALAISSELLLGEPAESGSLQEREFWQTVHEQRMWANLGLYYAEKTYAAIDLRYFHDTGDEEYRAKAMEHVENEIAAWKAYAEEFSRYFSPQLYGRLQWVVYPEYLIPDVEAEAGIVTKWRARPIKR